MEKGTLSEQRYNICKSCSNFRKLTKQCRICECFMPIKTKIVNSTCPENKW